MKTRSLMVTAMALAVFLLPSTRAHAEPIAAGDILRLSFDLTGLPPGYIEFGNLDYFEFAIFLAPSEPITSFTTRLFDGDQLLGTFTSPFTDASPSPTSVISRFMSPTSGYPGVATVIDFSTFNDGTIDGRIEFTISSGSGTLIRTSDELSVGQGVRGPFIAFTSSIPTRTFEVIPAEAPVPEPGTIFLAATGLAAAIARRRRCLRE